MNWAEWRTKSYKKYSISLRKPHVFFLKSHHIFRLYQSAQLAQQAYFSNLITQWQGIRVQFLLHNSNDIYLCFFLSPPQ